MESRKYTAQELSDCADGFEDTDIPYWIAGTRWDEMIEMLRHAAEMREVIDKLVKLISDEICYPSESNCKNCSYRRGSDCGSRQNNRMLYILKVAKGETK